jgi:hypothetical protein
LAGDVIGRESELAILHRFLDSIPTGPSALLLSGDPDIGKTTVWKQGLAGAQLRRYRTLACGPVEAETRLSYAALGDLLEPILEQALPTVPEPQRQALEVALELVRILDVEVALTRFVDCGSRAVREVAPTDH